MRLIWAIFSTAKSQPKSEIGYILTWNYAKLMNKQFSGSKTVNERVWIFGSSFFQKFKREYEMAWSGSWEIQRKFFLIRSIQYLHFRPGWIFPLSQTLANKWRAIQFFFSFPLGKWFLNHPWQIKNAVLLLNVCITMMSKDIRKIIEIYASTQIQTSTL